MIYTVKNNLFFISFAKKARSRAFFACPDQLESSFLFLECVSQLGTHHQIYRLSGKFWASPAHAPRTSPFYRLSGNVVSGAIQRSVVATVYRLRGKTCFGIEQTSNASAVYRLSGKCFVMLMQLESSFLECASQLDVPQIYRLSGKSPSRRSLRLRWRPEPPPGIIAKTPTNPAPSGVWCFLGLQFRNFWSKPATPDRRTVGFADFREVSMN